MNCFNHQERNAIGICKVCNKALCLECSTNSNEGLSCKGKCEITLKQIDQVVNLNIKRAKYFKYQPYWILIVLIIIFGYSFYQSYQTTNNTVNNGNDTDNIQNELYKKIELGTFNTFPMDTVILKTRKIYFNYDFNELTCGWLIKLLLLLDSQNNSPIDLYICSSGGYISEAKAIINIFKIMHSKVNTYAVGYCASSALRTVSSGTGKRCAFSNAILVFHGAHYSDLKDSISYDKIDSDIEISDWQKISKVSKANILDSNEITMNPENALKLGFIDTIVNCDIK